MADTTSMHHGACQHDNNKPPLALAEASKQKTGSAVKVLYSTTTACQPVEQLKLIINLMRINKEPITPGLVKYSSVLFEPSDNNLIFTLILIKSDNFNKSKMLLSELEGFSASQNE